MNGWLILDKPTGITSAYAVARVKKLLSRHPAGREASAQDLPQLQKDSAQRLRRSQNDKIKIGHAGTLDPLASGLLPLALGEATKTVAYMMDAGKGYTFTVSWGEERDTDDREGQVTATSPNRPSLADIQAILPQFTGRIQQTPPIYSAIKVEGERAYALARSGETVELKAREVRVDSLSALSHRERDGVSRGEGLTASSVLRIGPHPSPLPEGGGIMDSSFLCHCGKGTYIRSLARDMGRLLGCYGHVSALRRVKILNFTEKDAISLEMLEEMVHKGALGFLRPVEAALDDILALDLPSDQATLLKRGQAVHLPTTIAGERESTTVLARCNGKAIAVCECSGRIVKPVRVFNL